MKVQSDGTEEYNKQTMAMANMNPNRPGPQTGNKQDTHTHIQRNLRSNLKVKKKKV